MPKMEGKKREEIAQQMVDTVNWREAHRKESLVGKPQEEAEEEMLNEDLRVSEFMHKNSALSFGLPNAEQLVRIGLRIVPEHSVVSFLSTAREYLEAAKYGNEDVLLETLQKLRDVEESMTTANRKQFPGLGPEFHAAMQELIQAAEKLRKPIGTRKRAA